MFELRREVTDACQPNGKYPPHEEQFGSPGPNTVAL